MPRISVIIPTYKHREFILAALKSVFGQTYTDLEVIVVNDGSPDDTASILKPLIDSGKIRYIEQPNAGQAAARNRGLQEACGEYIAYLDDDDAWPADKLAWQVEFLDRSPEVGIVGGAAERVDEAGQSLGVVPADGVFTFESLFGQNPMISPGQCLIRGSMLRELGGFDAHLWGTDDWDLWFRATSKMRLVMIPRVALLYRVHASNASRDLTRMLRNSLLVVDRHLPSLPADQRGNAQQKVYRLLFDYLASSVIRGIVPALVRGDMRRARESISLGSRFVVPSIKDPKLIAMGVRDLMPWKLRRFASKVKRGWKADPLPITAVH